MRFRLRTLMILVAILPPITAGAWYAAQIALAKYWSQNSADGWEPCTDFRVETTYPADPPTQPD